MSATSTGRRGIGEVGVVIPARNESETIGGCLRSVFEAGAQVDLRCLVILVLDSCTDDSAEVAAAAASASGALLTTIRIDAGSVGVARGAGVRALLEEADVPPEQLWIANTDADSVVPRSWLTAHLAHARRGARVVAGTVVVEDWSAWPEELRHRYERGYARAPDVGHGHVHGANLGISADVYTRLGGFRQTESGEDVDLLRRARDHDVPIVWAVDNPVRTSARPVGRAPGGFAGHLGELTLPTSGAE